MFSACRGYRGKEGGEERDATKCRMGKEATGRSGFISFHTLSVLQCCCSRRAAVPTRPQLVFEKPFPVIMQTLRRQHHLRDFGVVRKRSVSPDITFQRPSRRPRLSPPPLKLDYGKQETAVVRSKLVKGNKPSDILKLAPPTPSVSTVQRKETSGGYVRPKTIPASPGIIIYIELCNILSHRHFYYYWHPQLNYVTGENGSGKTSIMLGIMLGLGGTARDLKKNSVKDFACWEKAPNEISRVEIVLSHGDLLDSKLYGETVNVRRYIDGSQSRYTVRTTDGSWRKMNKSEWDRILVTLNINVSNPTEFLIQSVAPNFLKVSDSQDIYYIFYRGTGLHDCETLLKSIKEDVAYAQKVLVFKSESLPTLQKKAEELEQELEKVHSLKRRKEKISELNKEYKWSLVVQMEREVRSKEEEFKGLLAKMEAYNLKMIKNKEAVEDLGKSTESEVLIKKAQSQRLSQLEREHQAKKKELEKVHIELRTSQLVIDSTTKSILGERDNIRGLEREIQEIEEDKRNSERKRLEAEARWQELDEQRIAKKNELTKANENNTILKDEVERCKRSYDEQQSATKKAAKTKEMKETELKNPKLEKSEYLRFGGHMVQLMARVEANLHKFRDRPRGPMAACYTVKEKYAEFAPVIDFYMRSDAYSFKVTNNEDLQLLTKLMSEVYGYRAKRPDVDIVKVHSYPEKRYDLKKQAKAKHCPFPTLLDCLDIKDNDSSVMNWLVDAKAVDRILIFPSVNDGCAILRSKDKDTLPDSTLTGYTKDFFKIRPIPKHRVDPLSIANIKRLPEFVQVTSMKDSYYEKLQQDVRELEEQHREHQALCVQLKADLGRKNQIYQRAVEEAKKINQSLFQIQRAQDLLKYNIQSAWKDPVSLKQDIGKSQARIEEYEVEIRQHTATVARLTPIVNQWTAELDQLTMDKMTAENELISLEPKQNAQLKDKLDREEKKLQRDLRSTETERDGLIQIINTKKLELTRKTKEAEKVCSRIDTDRDGEAIKKEIGAHEQVLQKNQVKLSKISAIEMACEKAKNAANKLEKDVDIITCLLTPIQQMLYAGEELFSKTKINYGVMLKASFNDLISTRHYKGELHIDHEAKELTYYVCADSKAEEYAKENFSKRENGNFKIVNKKGIKDFMRGLSGGEKAFSTFCFMNVFWPITGAKLFVMDEFEVFMDEDHQGKCHQILREYAGKNQDCQFFCFSPKPNEYMPSSEAACVLKLDAPDRGQKQLQGKKRKIEEEENEFAQKKLTVD